MPEPMTILEAVNLFRSGDPTTLTDDQARRLGELLSSTPSVAVLVENPELVAIFQKHLQERQQRPAAKTPEKPAEVLPHPTTSKKPLILAGLAIPALAAAGYFLSADPPAPTAGIPKAQFPDGPPVAVPTPAPVAPEPAAPVPTAVPEPLPVQPTPPPPPPPVSEPPPDPALRQEPDFRVKLGAAELKKEGEAKWRVTSLVGDTYVSLRGPFKELELGDMNGKARIEIKEVKNADIHIRGKINGSGRLKITATDTNVYFHQPLDGRVEVDVICPGGRIVFLNEKENPATPRGGVRLKLTAKEIDFQAGIDGGCRAEVVLTADGALSYAYAAGGAEIRFRRRNGGDPALRLNEGPIRDGAEVTGK